MPAKGPTLAISGASSPSVGAAQELDDATLERLQHQLLEDDEFADDMRALLLARFREKHRRKGGGGAPADDGSEASDEHSSDETADPESEPDPAELNRLKELGYELQQHERLLSKAPRTSRKKTQDAMSIEDEAAELPVCDEQGLMQKLEELKYAPPPGMRRVPFIETLAFVVDAAAAAEGGGETPTQIDVSDDLKREAAFVGQLQKTVPVALARLRALGLQFTRPTDFLAEMLKSDQQMGRIRARINAEQEQQRQFEAKKNQRLNKKFNKLSGHQLVREQEEARRRNIQLRAIDQWKKDRQAAVRAGTANKEAEDEFDQWLVGNEQDQKSIAPNHGHSFKNKGGPRKAGVHKPHGRRGKNAKSKGASAGRVGRRKGGLNKKGHK